MMERRIAPPENPFATDRIVGLADFGVHGDVYKRQGLAIKGINLFQGNKGLELWRLKASWAHMSQNGDTIDVDKPVVRYALGEGSASNPDEDVYKRQA